MPNESAITAATDFIREASAADLTEALSSVGAPGFVLLDERDRIIWASPSAASVLGWRSESVVERTAGDLTVIDHQAVGPSVSGSARALCCVYGEDGSRRWMWRVSYRLRERRQTLWQVFSVSPEDRRRFAAPTLEEVFSSGVSVSLVLDANAEIQYAAGVVPWALQSPHQLPSAAAYLDRRHYFALGAAIDSTLQRGTPRSLRIAVRAFDTSKLETWSCRVSVLQSTHAEYVSLVAIDDSHASGSQTNEMTMPAPLPFSLPDSERHSAQIAKAWKIVARDLDRLGAHSEISAKTRSAPHLVDVTAWRKTFSVLRHLSRTSSHIAIQMRWLPLESSEARRVGNGAPVLCVDLLASAPPPESTATGLRRIENGDRSWLGALSRAVAGHMQIDGSTGVITFFLLGSPRPGVVKSPTALVVSSDATTRRHASDLVKRAGFTPITVDDPYRALTVAAESAQELSLLIADASFDVMSCVELHDDVKLRHAEIRAIYLSGAPVVFGSARDSDWAILRSPLSPKALNGVLSTWGLGKLDALPPERHLKGRQRWAK